ncbi:MAG: acyl-CoA dehydrogenase family protein [SAR324 cluster bacterium]|nr:acyl-CoA dehydrogenase family protein [SAR324 cluster bacterium]
MNFALSDEQQMLQASAAEFVKRESPLSRVRALREDETGFSRDLWRKMAELGWLGMAYPESLGGADMGAVETIVVMEELGRGLLPEPMLATVLLGGMAILRAGNDDQQKALLPAMVNGERFLSLAYLERQARHDPFDVTTSARQNGGSWVLSGEKTFVPDAAVADRVVVSARTGGAQRTIDGITLFLVDPKADGVTLTDIPGMDCRKRYVMKLDGVKVDDGDRLGESGQGGTVLDGVLDWASVGLCGEMLGGMVEAFRMTLEYLKTREQFGVPIGSFQALKHRAADEYVQTELARSAVYYAAMALDEKLEDAQAAVSTAKARCNDAFHVIANESLQMHGGIGMTDEHDIGFYFKRAHAAEVTLGDSTYHRDRYARLKGY